MAFAFGTVVTAGPSGSFGTVTMSCAAGSILLFFVYNEANSGTQHQVTSITGASLSFTKRGAYIGNDPGRAGNKVALELWSAYSAAALTGAVFTINMNSNFDDGALVAVPVTGFFDPTNPWDTNAAVPVTAANAALAITTSQKDDLLLWASGSSFNLGAQALPSGWTQLGAAGTGGGSLFSSMRVAYKTVSVTQSAAAVSSASSGSVEYADAMTADNTKFGGAVTIISG